MNYARYLVVKYKFKRAMKARPPHERPEFKGFQGHFVFGHGPA